MHHHHLNPFAAFFLGYAANQLMNNAKPNTIIHQTIKPVIPVVDEKNTPLHSNRKTQAQDVLKALSDSYGYAQKRLDETNSRIDEHNSKKEVKKKGSLYFWQKYPPLPLLELPTIDDLIKMLDSEDVRTIYELKEFIHNLQVPLIDKWSAPLSKLNCSNEACVDLIIEDLRGVKGFGNTADWYNEGIKKINKERSRRNSSRGLIELFSKKSERIIPKLKPINISEKEIKALVFSRNPTTWDELRNIKDIVFKKVYANYINDPDYDVFRKA